MDENQIQADLAAKNTTPSIPQLNPQYPDPEPVDNPGTGTNLPLEGFAAKNELMQFFDIKPTLWNNAANQETIGAIYEWARNSTGSNDLTDILRAINHQETLLGSRLRSDRLNRLYQYVRIQKQHAALVERERSLYS